MKQSQAEPVRLARADAQAPQGLELRHLRYLVAVADAGTFTRAAEQLFIAQPTLSQQIRRLEEVVGTPLLRRRRDGVRLTTAGAVLLDATRDVLSLVDHGVSRTRQAAGLGRQRLRMVMPSNLPEALTAKTATSLRSAATAADVDLVWMETPLDAEFSLIRQHQADAGLGWLTAGPDALPAPLDAMTLAEFEPDLWIPASHPAAGRGTITLAEMASLHVIYGPRRASPGTYDRWLDVLRTADPHFAFTDPPFRHSLPVALAFAATADPPAAVLTGRTATAGTSPGVIRRLRPADTGDMIRVSIADRPLTATAALVWNGDLPRPLQQILFETADGATPPAPASLSRAPCRRCRPGVFRPRVSRVFFRGRSSRIPRGLVLRAQPIGRVLEPHGIVLEEARKVADDLGLPYWWLNEQASVYISGKEDVSRRRVFDHPGLRVMAASSAHVFAMNARAARTRDIDDLRLLADIIGVNSADAGLQICADFYPDEPVSAR